MSYQDESPKAAEYLRQVIPILSKHKLPATPVNYSVFYSYVSGTSLALNEAIDSNIKQNKTFTTPLLVELYEKYINGSAAIVQQEKIQASLSKIMEEASEEVQSANQGANNFDQTLNQHATALSDTSDPDSAAMVLQQILQDTRQMARSTSDLQARMQDTNAEVLKLKAELNAVKETAEKDALTGLKNRGTFDLAINETVLNQAKDGIPNIIIMIDIDHFKRINDNFGHLVGDRVIRYVAALLTQIMGPDNFIARYGGEEFVVLIKDQNIEIAFKLAEKVRTAMGNSKLQRKDSGETIGKVTLSAGIACQKDSDTVDLLIDRGDKALYEAKNTGRNKTVIAD
jgi:diguanylate cyclase